MVRKTSDRAGGGKIQLKYVRSSICAPTNQVIERPDTPAIRGMVAKVPHLVEIVQQ